MEQKLISFTKQKADKVTDFAEELAPYFEQGFTVKQFSNQWHLSTSQFSNPYFVVTALLEKATLPPPFTPEMS